MEDSINERSPWLGSGPLQLPKSTKDLGENGSTSRSTLFRHKIRLGSWVLFIMLAICSCVLTMGRGHLGILHWQWLHMSKSQTSAPSSSDISVVSNSRKISMTNANQNEEGEGSDGSIRLIHEPQYAITGGELNYLVLGDWGRRGLYNQSEVATQMGRIGEQLGIEFVISVGDNFYDTGLTGPDDPAFAASFTDVYTSSSLQTVWYSVLGNHDYMGDALCQLSEEIAKRDPRWFCRKEFQLHVPLSCIDDSDMTLTEGGASCNASVDMFFIDTTPFIDEYWSPNQTQTFDWRGLAPRPQQLQSQLARLVDALGSSNATWKIVFGHHTIRSVGHHGDLTELVDQLLPILEKYEVDMYINGHDHNLQHIKRSESSVHLFTSGAGSKAYSGLRPYTQEGDGVEFAYDGQGFLSVSMRPQSVALTFYDVNGHDIYSYDLQK